MQAGDRPSDLGARFRLGLALCFVGIAILLLMIISGLTPYYSASLLWAGVGVVVVVVGAIVMSSRE